MVITRVPHTPNGVEAVAGHGSVTVSWNGVPDAESYNLYWSTLRNITTDTGNKISDVTSPYTLTGLSDNETYFFLVTAVNSGFDGLASDVAQATSGWITEAVAATTSTTDERDTSIAVDSARNPHIHYSYNEYFEPSSEKHYNYYTTEQAGTWTSVFVGNTLWTNASIALDSSDTVHVGYLDSPGLIHGVYTSGNWISEVIDSEAEVSASIEADVTGKLHTVYCASDYPAEILRYSNNTSGSWTSTTFYAYPGFGCSSRGLSLSIDSSGAAHIAYIGSQPDYGLYYATNKGGIWSTPPVDQGYIEQVSIAVDPDDKAHIVYADNLGQLRYAQNVSGVWLIELLENAGSPKYPAISVDTAGKAHISYLDSQYVELRYTTNQSGVWQTIPIDHVGFVPLSRGANTDIAQDSQGNIYISYYRSGNLMYATNR